MRTALILTSDSDCRVIYSVDNDGKIDGESKYNIRSTEVQTYTSHVS
jgi:hypothetical protein